MLDNQINYLEIKLHLFHLLLDKYRIHIHILNIGEGCGYIPFYQITISGNSSITEVLILVNKLISEKGDMLLLRKTLNL